MRSALIIGATGAVGHHCLDMLLKDEFYGSVTALSRRNLGLHHPKLKEIVLDFDDLKSASEVFGVDDVFCCLGTTMKKAGSKEAFRKVDFEYPLEAARLASKQGAKQFLMITALGANPNSAIFYNRIKGEVEAAVRMLEFEGKFFFRPSLLIGERPETRIGEVLASQLFKFLGFLFVGPLKQYKAIGTETVARAMVHIAKQMLIGEHVIESAKIGKLFSVDKENNR
ncbi:NAD(P)H-binding protein [bacterium]|nr:NAD(P)H-binding protein [bacterium]